MRHAQDSSESEALSLVRAGLASVDISTASLADLRRLRELLGAAKAAQKVRLAATLSESRLRLDQERLRLARTNLRIARARAKLLEIERDQAVQAVQRRAERAKEAEASARYLQGLTGQDGAPWIPRSE